MREVNEERTPLNSHEASPVLRQQPDARTQSQLLDDSAHDIRTGLNLRKSQLANSLLMLFALMALIDVLVFQNLVNSIEWVGAQQIKFGESTRSLARLGQLATCGFTLLLGSFSLVVHRRWQASSPRYAAGAAKQFALLPEYTAISLVLDVGKLAYPFGPRVALVCLMMLSRVLAVAILLRITYLAGTRRGLVSHNRMPTMLRTLVSLEGVESKGLGDVVTQTERPLSIDLLEKLIVFLTPRKLGEQPKEGAGLARSSAMPLIVFAFLLTGTSGQPTKPTIQAHMLSCPISRLPCRPPSNPFIAAAVLFEYERLRSSQEPLLESSIANTMFEASLNESARLNWRPPYAQPVPPVTTFLVIISGINYQIGSKILSQAFDPAVNSLCALDVQTRCERHVLRNVLPSTSLPNWIAALTGASPTTHGVLGNFGVGPFPFDSIYAQVCGETADHQRWTELQRPPARNPSMRLRTTLCSRLRACARVLARRRSRTQSAQASPPPPGSST